MSNAKTVSLETSHHIRDTCLCLHAQRAARAMARHFDEALRPVDLTNGQFSILVSLNRPEPAGMGAVAEVLAMDRTTLTANLKPLERRGLVKIVTNPDDKRGRHLMLTQAGRKVLASALPIWTRAQAEAEALLGRSSPDRVRADLRALS